MSTDRLAALRACWHPVAYADVITAPHATTLLGEPLVLWRDARGAVHAFRDVCVHRGTALSLGRVDGNEIVCAYHGWRYGADGACTAIPQLAEPTRVPARARAVVYAVCERYGIVWVALAEPAWPIPDVPELENAAWRVVRTGPFAWACDASRQVENFTDFGHFAFVHPGLLGDPAQPVVAPYEVTTDGPVLRYALGRPDTANAITAAERTDATRRTRYALHLPYTIDEHIDWGSHEGLVYLIRGCSAILRSRWSRHTKSSSPPSRSPTIAASATAWSRATTTSSSPTTSSRHSSGRFSGRTSVWSSRSGPIACRSISPRSFT